MKKILLCGGGSAGHVMPNIAVYENLKNSFDFCYIGTDAIEKSISQTHGLTFYEFQGVKLRRGKIFCNLSIPFKLLKSYRQCVEIIENIRPDLVFSKGGYAALPPALAAKKLRIPVLTHESDLSTGLANKIISRFSDRTLTSFPETAKKFKNGVFTGSPMRESLFNRDKLEAKKAFGLDLRPTILVFGGGSGAKIINDALRKNINRICRRYNVLHLCGKGNAVDSNIAGYKQLEFCNDMGAAYAAADFAVARCGSNSAHELIALKIPTLFIPLSKGASRGDQVENAKYFKELGLCRVLEESLAEDKLNEEIENLIHDENLKAALSLSGLKCGNDNIRCEIESVIARDHK